MMITIGQLVATLFDTYGRSLHDDELASVATEVHINELLWPIARSSSSSALA